MAKIDFKENGSKGVEGSRSGAQKPEDKANKDEANFKAAFTHKRMYKIEEALGHQNLAVSRRLTLGVLTQSKAKLLKNAKEEFSKEHGEDEDILFIVMIEQVKQFKEAAQNMLEFAQAAEARLMIVANELMEECKQEQIQKSSAGIEVKA